MSGVLAEIFEEPLRLCLGDLTADAWPSQLLIELPKPVGGALRSALSRTARFEFGREPLRATPGSEDLRNEPLHAGTVCGTDAGYNDRRLTANGLSVYQRWWEPSRAIARAPVGVC